MHLSNLFIIDLISMISITSITIFIILRIEHKKDIKREEEFLKRRENSRPTFDVVEVSFASNEEIDIISIYADSKCFSDNSNCLVSKTTGKIEYNNLKYIDYSFKNVTRFLLWDFIIALEEENSEIKYIYDDVVTELPCLSDDEYYENNSVKVRIYYQKEADILELRSKKMLILFGDDHNYHYKQIFSLKDVSLSPSSDIDRKEFLKYLKIDDVLKFRKGLK